MSEAGHTDWNSEGRTAWAQPRAVGAPLSRGAARHPSAGALGAPRQLAPPPGRPLPNSSGDPETSHASSSPSSSVDRIVHAVRSAVPFVQRLLPLLDGNVAGAVVNVLSSHAQKQTAQAPVNLAPVQNQIGELQIQQAELGHQVQEQTGMLQRTQDQLEMVREATDRNTLEQQELMEDLKTMGRKINLVAVLALGLLAISVALNLILYLHLERVLP